MDFVESDAGVGEQGVGMGGDQNLPARLRMHSRHETGQVPHQRVVQGEFRFLQQQRPAAFRQRPEQADQP